MPSRVQPQKDGNRLLCELGVVVVEGEGLELDERPGAVLALAAVTDDDLECCELVWFVKWDDGEVKWTRQGAVDKRRAIQIQ